MFSPTRTALYIAIGAMAFAAGEANAGCKYIPNPPGSLVCAAWITGSEICNVVTDVDATLVSETCSITGFNFIVRCGSGDGNDGGVLRFG